MGTGMQEGEEVTATLCDLRLTVDGLYNLLCVLADGTERREKNITMERALEILKEVGAGDIE